MPRRLITLFLLLAVAGTGVVAYLLLGESGRGDRRDRAGAALRDETETGRARPPPAGEPRREPEPARVQGEWRVTGRVEDGGGRPIAGAVVRATLPDGLVQAVTDADGRYEHRLAWPAVDFDVIARGYLPLAGTANGRSNGRLRFLFQGRGPWTRDFVLKAAATLTGFLRDENGMPVAGAQVYVLPPELQVVDRLTVGNVVTSDATGAFAFPGLAPAVYDLGARAPGYLPGLARDVAVPERGAIRRELVLRKGRRIEVEIVNAPPPPRRVLVVAADSRLREMLLPPGGLAALRDALVGRAWADYPVVSGWGRELGGVGAGPADVEAQVYQGDGARRDDSFLVEEGLGRLLDTTEPQLTLTLVPGILIEINARDAVTGLPLEPKILRRTEGAASDMPLDSYQGGVGVDNLYWAPRDDRRHALRFSLDGYQDSRLDLPTLQARDARFPPRHTHPFDVAMVPTAQGETGGFFLLFEPALAGRVALVGRDADGLRQWVRYIERPDGKGRWEAKGIPVGQYSVAILSTGMIPVVVPQVAIARGIKETLRVQLTKGGGLSFQVTDRDGKLLDKVYLRLEEAGGNQIDVQILTHVSEGQAFLSVNYLPSAAAAKADSGLAPGNYTLTVGREGYEPAAREFTISGTEIAEVAIELTPRQAPR